jgi:DNA-binding NtrC family response regulator
MKHRICLIEDDELLGEALLERFDVAGYACDWFKDGASALDALQRSGYSVVVSDINLPDLSGEALFSRLRERSVPLPPFLFMTGYGAIDQAVRLLKLGAEDYLAKPFEVTQLMHKVAALCERLAPASAHGPQLGVSAAMRALEITIARLAGSNSTVLISGESGVGKEYIARALHGAEHATGERPFIAINCGAIPEPLLESELFGHVKGAFTGALRDKPGLFAQAAGGTLFLDEVGDMPLAMQVKLLRAIQERNITPVGGERALPVKLKLVCATHRNLADMVSEGSFREDLFYRINVVNLEVPPLRERKEDILGVAHDFIRQHAGNDPARSYRFHPQAEEALLGYPWPGNIRELHNCLERACLLSSTAVLTPEDLFGDAWESVLQMLLDDRPSQTLSEHLQQAERAYIRRMLTEHQGRIALTADALGVSRKTLWEKMRRLGLNEP